MKGLIFALAILFLILVFSFAYADEKDLDLTKVSITFEERKELTPDIFQMFLSVNVLTNKEREAINMLGDVDKEIRTIGLNYSGGNYSIYKNCWWEKEKRKCSGFRGTLNYNFQLKDVKEGNKILEIIDSFKEKYGASLNYSLSEPQWILSEKTRKSAEEELKLSLLDTAKAFLKKLSNKLEKKCSISHVDYDLKAPSFREFSAFQARSAEQAPIEAPEPKKEKQVITINANVKYVCR